MTANRGKTMELDDRTAVASLQSTTCPCCGGAKERGHTFCSADYYALPVGMQRALYRKVSHGYLEAVKAALNTHGVCEPFLG